MSRRATEAEPVNLAAKPPVAPACAFVILGAGGDLTKRLLVPALYNLELAGLLDERFEVLGIDRLTGDDHWFRGELLEMLRAFVAERGGGTAPASVDDACWDGLAQRLHYHSGDFADPATFQALVAALGTRSAIFYLATAARFFGPLVDQLGEAKLLAEPEGGFRRVVIEKPFGTDLASAEQLNARILRHVGERQIYRIDHYLGKETVQNIMALRFSNGIFEPLWQRDHIDHVQITVAETVGVGTRGAFYEATGAVRDMVPNHVMQLLAMTAMEAPNSFDADAVRAEKAKAVQAIQPLSSEQARLNVVRGQYRPGALDGAAVPGYRQEHGVDPASETETYIAMKFAIDNWRWAGVPFYLRTGKRLAARRTEIAIQFKPAPFALFRDTPVDLLAPNRMVLHIQPSEGVSLQFSAKVPGPKVRLGAVTMKFDYADHFHVGPSTGYETLLYDCMAGDATLFQRADNI